ncbi:MAG: type II secretion system protein [Clostridiales bacterium]|nr:type II secretion system protein [Clostridiales bacterium]
MKKTIKTMDNKGFSLVELIIVIAIMAILVGVIGSQVIPYIEKSRVSKDKSTLDTAYTSWQTVISKEHVVGGPNSATLQNLRTTFVEPSYQSDSEYNLDSEFTSLFGAGVNSAGDLSKKFSSKTLGNNPTINFWYGNNGVIAVSLENAGKSGNNSYFISSGKESQLKEGTATLGAADVGVN